VLDLEVGNAVGAERHGRRGFDGARVCVLEREDIDLRHTLLAIERDLHPVGEGARGRIVPAAAAAPAETLAVAVVDGTEAIARAVRAGRRRKAAVGLRGHVDWLLPSRRSVNDVYVALIRAERIGE